MKLGGLIGRHQPHPFNQRECEVRIGFAGIREDVPLVWTARPELRDELVEGACERLRAGLVGRLESGRESVRASVEKRVQSLRRGHLTTEVPHRVGGRGRVDAALSSDEAHDVFRTSNRGANRPESAGCERRRACLIDVLMDGSSSPTLMSAKFDMSGLLVVDGLAGDGEHGCACVVSKRLDVADQQHLAETLGFLDLKPGNLARNERCFSGDGYSNVGDLGATVDQVR